jgi:hypothetical protein
MALDTDDLIVLFRSEMSDPELPGDGDDSDSLWSDAEITEWIGEAQKELCQRVDLLFDRSSFKIDTVEQQDLYALDERITKVRRGVGPNGRHLDAISIAELERRYQNGTITIDFGNWETAEGDPRYIVTDYAIGFARLVPIPPNVEGEVATEEIKLDVYREPMDPTVLEIPNSHRKMLLYKVKAYAYRKDDIDTNDTGRSDVWDGRWEAALHDIDRRFKRKNRGAQVVQYGGI